jgi:hypothetical protein
MQHCITKRDRPTQNGRFERQRCTGDHEIALEGSEPEVRRKADDRRRVSFKWCVGHLFARKARAHADDLLHQELAISIPAQGGIGTR